MHEIMLREIVKVCRQRQREGDHPTIAAFGVETLEDAVVDLAEKLDKLLPDPEVEAGVLHWEAPLPAGSL